jgi:hypothetical protein
MQKLFTYRFEVWSVLMEVQRDSVDIVWLCIRIMTRSKGCLAPTAGADELDSVTGVGAPSDGHVFVQKLSKVCLSLVISGDGRMCTSPVLLGFHELAEKVLERVRCLVRQCRASPYRAACTAPTAASFETCRGGGAHARIPRASGDADVRNSRRGNAQTTEDLSARGNMHWRPTCEPYCGIIVDCVQT